MYLPLIIWENIPKYQVLIGILFPKKERVKFFLKNSGYIELEEKDKMVQ